MWEVSEPYISVWLYDEPIYYRSGLGYPVSFKLAYKQRETRQAPAGLFSLGKMWDCSWLTYVIDDGSGMAATLVLPGGGEQDYTPDGQTHEFFSGRVMQRNWPIAMHMRILASGSPE
jgi:hypothetical protein